MPMPQRDHSPGQRRRAQAGFHARATARSAVQLQPLFSRDLVLRAAHDHFQGTLEAAWSSTTVDADLKSCSRCQTLFECARAYAGWRPLCPNCLEQDHGVDMHMDPDYHSRSVTSSDDYSCDQSETSSESDDSTYDCAYDVSSFHEESSSFADVLGEQLLEERLTANRAPTHSAHLHTAVTAQ